MRIQLSLPILVVTPKNTVTSRQRSALFMMPRLYLKAHSENWSPKITWTKMIARGHPPEFISTATKKILPNAAYEAVTKERCLSPRFREGIDDKR